MMLIHSTIAALCAILLTPPMSDTESASDGYLVSLIPERVVLDCEGNARVAGRVIQPTPLHTLRETLPTFIPVYRELAGGQSVVGVDIVNKSSTPLVVTGRWYPGMAELQQDGAWHVHLVRCSIDDAAVPANSTIHIPGSDDAKLVVYDDTSKHLYPIHPEAIPPSPTLDYYYSHANAPAGVSESRVRKMIDRAIYQYERLFERESLSCTIHFLWSGLLC